MRADHLLPSHDWLQVFIKHHCAYTWLGDASLHLSVVEAATNSGNVVI